MKKILIPVTLIALSVAAAFVAPAALAQAYPAKPIRTIVTVAGGVEAAVRALSNRVSESIGQPVKSPQEFAATVKRNYEQAGKLVKAVGIEPE